MSAPLERGLMAGLLVTVLAATTGCDDETEPVLPRASKAKVTAPQESLAGTWEPDGEGFLEENGSLLLAQIQPTIDGIRLARARVAALPAEEQAARQAEIDVKLARLPAPQREMVEAAIVGPEAVREKLRGLMAAQLRPDMIRFVFSESGTCTLESTLPGGTRQRAEGTWSGTGPAFTVQLVSVNGKPAKGRDLKPATLTLRKGLLRYQPHPDSPTLVAKRVGA
jgi:hypothetical protein